MKKANKVDFSKLLGFDALGDGVSEDVDFRDETFGAKLGAKVGLEPVKPADASDKVSE